MPVDLREAKPGSEWRTKGGETAKFLEQDHSGAFVFDIGDRRRWMNVSGLCECGEASCRDNIVDETPDFASLAAELAACLNKSAAVIEAFIEHVDEHAAGHEMPTVSRIKAEADALLARAAAAGIGREGE